MGGQGHNRCSCPAEETHEETARYNKRAVMRALADVNTWPGGSYTIPGPGSPLSRLVGRKTCPRSTLGIDPTPSCTKLLLCQGFGSASTPLAWPQTAHGGPAARCNTENPWPFEFGPRNPQLANSYPCPVPLASGSHPSVWLKSGSPLDSSGKTQVCPCLVPSRRVMACSPSMMMAKAGRRMASTGVLAAATWPMASWTSHRGISASSWGSR